jgi:hypothetical protein
MKYLTDEKLAIFGSGGAIGSNMVQAALTMGLTPNIVMYDPFDKGNEGAAEEIYHCAFPGARVTWTSDVREALDGASYLISSGGAPRKEGMTREDLLKGNAEIAAQLGRDIKAHCPDLKFGVIEQGASWIPSWMRFMESAFDAFHKREERLQKLSMRPSDFVRRQIRATPYPAEDVGWTIRNAGEEVCLFSSDYPHVEGGRNPIKRFEESMLDLNEVAKTRFYSDNFIDLMGKQL